MFGAGLAKNQSSGMQTDWCVFIDAGHGGLDPNGQYTTAPAKMVKHARGVFHGNGFFYEGVWNRLLTQKVMEKLAMLGVKHLPLHHAYLDTPLEQRVAKANWYARFFSKTFLISTHANASVDRRARGFEVYTTPGRTASDDLASLQWNNVNALLGNLIQMRQDTSDGDHDREANFFILRKTTMPAILIEHLFFDNFEDATLLMNEDVVDLFADAQVRTILEFFHA